MVRPMIHALCTAFLLCLTSLVKADDPGYFLSWQQKKDLLCLGRIQDSAGTWYDVWICPGYFPPARYAREHLKEAGANFHEYVEANKYQSLKEGSKACFNWALEECGLGFTVKGIPRAWGRHFTVAHERTQRRVFGWWMAYPWAFMESTAETAFRGVLGSVGTAGGIVSGVAIVPAYHALDSAVAGVWNLGVNTVMLPVVGVGWNTVVGPPLALVGQKPSESRVDGFWVTIVGSDRAPITRHLSQEEVSLLGQWGLLLLKETQPFAQKQIEIERNAAEQEAQLRRAIQAMRAEADRQRTELRKEENALIQQVAATNELSFEMLSQHSALAYGGDCEADVRRYLKGLNISGEDVERVLNLLRAYQSPRAVVPSQVRQKTDPLRRSVEVIGESAADALK